MHALSRFISQALTARKMTPAEFARASGLSDQLVSQLLNAKTDRMASMPKQRTIEGIARACNVPESYVVGVAVEAMGYDLGQARDAVDLSSLDDEALLAELGARLNARREGVGNDERSAAIKRAGASPASNVQVGPWPEKGKAPPIPFDVAADIDHNPPRAQDDQSDPHAED